MEEAYRELPYSVAQFNKLWELFRKLVRAAGVVYYVVDRLDKCSGTSVKGSLRRSLFAKRLTELAKPAIGEFKLKILFSSRNKPDIQCAFESIATIVDTISIINADVDRDIATYITNRIDHLGNLSILSKIYHIVTCFDFSYFS